MEDTTQRMLGSFAQPTETQRFWSLLKRRWLPATGALACTLAGTAVFTLLQQPIYEAEGQMVFRRISSASALTGVAEKQSELTPISQQGSPLETESELLRSVPIVQSVIDGLGLKDEWGAPLKRKEFLKHLGIKNIAKTDLLRISYQSKSAAEATAVVNALMGNHLKDNILINRAEAMAARRFIEAQLPKSEREVRRLDAALRRFREQNHIVNLDEEARVAVKVGADLDNELAKARADLRDVTAQAEAFRQQMGLSARDALASGALGQAPGVQKLLDEYQQVQGQLAVQSTRFKAQHPTVQNLQARLDALEALLRERVRQIAGRTDDRKPLGRLSFGTLKEKLTEEFVRIEVRTFGQASRYAALSRTRRALEDRLANLPRLDQQERELGRRLKATQESYETLMRKLQDIRLAENQKIGNARIVAATVPEEPIAPRPLINLLAGTALGLLIGAATALVLERRDRTIKTVQQARQVLPGTVLAAIPLFPKDSEPLYFRPDDPATGVVVRESPSHPISELFRILHVNLRFVSRERQPRVIVVTSAVAGEGKSTVAANLAAAVAQFGRRPLLIDADLRNPSQHRLWRLDGEPGLNAVLSGAVEPHAAIRTPAGGPDLLVAGEAVENPVHLLASGRI